MDQDNTKLSVGLIEQFGETGELTCAKPARRHERSGRYPGRQRDQRHVAAPAQKRKALHAVIAAHVIAPERGRSLFDPAHIDVVIAGHDSDVMRIADRRQPGAGPLGIPSGSEKLTRSPVTAMWSKCCALRSRVIASRTSGRWMALRLRCQLIRPRPRLPASSPRRGCDAICRSDKWARVNIVL